MAQNRQLKNAVYYSVSSDSNLRGEIIENDPFLTIDWIANTQRHRVKTNLTGPYNLENVLAGIAIGKYFDLTADEINLGISSYNPANNRSQITKTESNTLICDYYNANPSSMSAALDNFSAISASNKVLILGDMFELGDESVSEHKAIVEKAIGIKADEKIFIGKNFFQNKSEQALFFETTEEAYESIKQRQLKDSTVLIKGSRGMKMEKLVEIL